MNSIRNNSIFLLFCLLSGLIFTPVLVSAQADTSLIEGDISLVKVDSSHVRTDTVLTKADSIAVYFFRTSLDSLKDGRLYALDTSLTYFHQYNPTQKYNQMYAGLGNIGLAGKNRVFSPSLSINFSLTPSSFTPYLFTNKDIKYYQLIRPYTDLNYGMGPNKEQNLGVAFSRTLSKRLVLGVQLSIIHSPGAYLNQMSNINNAYFTGRYNTKDKRYGIIANYMHNKLLIQENGGLVYDSVFEQHLETDKKVVPVQLAKAENQMKLSGLFVEQYFNLLKPLKNINSHRKIDPGNISYAFQYLKSQNIYTDDEPKAKFYAVFPAVFDTVSTRDSTYQIRIRNRFKWSNQGYHDDRLSQVFHLYGGIQFDYIKQHLAYDSIDKTYNETSPFGGLTLKLFQRSILNARVDYTLGGYHAGDFKLAASLLQYLGSEEKNVGIITLNLKIASRMPAWYYSYYSSNRFNWDNQFNKEHLLILQGEYQYKGFKAGVHLLTIQHYTFLNDSIKPKQLSTTGSIFQLYTEGNFLIHHFGVNFRVVRQSTTMGHNLHLPTFTGKLDLFYKNWVFKKAARLQTGIQLAYFTSYYSDAYMPALRIFYLQSQKQIGDYLFVDVYATLRVQTLRFFVKASNLLGYTGNYHYYESPHYPGLAPGIFLGFNWRFHN